MLKLKKDQESRKELLIEICNKCYLKCKFCSSRGNERNNLFLNIKFIKKIIKEAKKTTISVIQLSGGEPFTHPYFFEICKFIKRNKSRFIVYTSGNIKKKDVLKPLNYKIINKLKKYNITAIRFNFQSYKEEIHNNLTGAISYQNTVESIRRVIKSGITCEVHLIPLKTNFKDFEKTLAFLTKLGVSKVKFLRFIPHGRGLSYNTELELNSDEYHELITSFLFLKKKYKDFIEIGSAFNQKDDKINDNICKRCQIGKNKIVITPNAYLYPCVSTKNLDFYNFNLKEKSYREIIDSKKYNSKVRQFYSLIKYFNTECPTQAYINLRNTSSNHIIKIHQ